MLQDTLDHKHNVRTTRIIFIKHNCHWVTQCPWQDPFVEFCNLFAVFQFDGVLTDKVNPADVTVQVHAHRGPIQTGCNLFDVG